MHMNRSEGAKQSWTPSEKQLRSTTGPLARLELSILGDEDLDGSDFPDAIV